MTIKPVASLVLAGALALSVAACGSSNSGGAGAAASASSSASTTSAASSGSSTSAATSGSSTSAAKPAKTFSVTLSLGEQAGCPFCIEVQRGAEAAAKKYGVKLTTVGPSTASLQQQIQELDATLQSKPDGLLVEPDDGQAIIATMQQFKNAHIPAITVDTDANDMSLRLGTVTSDNTAGGKLAAVQINKLTGGNGEVAYIGYTPGLSSTDQREKGFTAQLKKYPGLKYVGAQYTADDENDAATKVSAVLQRNPNLKAIFAGDEANAIGAGIALRQKGLAGKVVLVAFDGAPDEVQALKQGSASVLIVQNAFQIGYAGLKEMYEYLAHKTAPPAAVNPGYVLATKSNIDTPAVKKFLYPAH
jgi:ribose transport system substrate-binding protein